MKTALMAVFLCLSAIAPCISATAPSFTAEVSAAGDLKEYVYTLTNDLDSGTYVWGFDVFMPTGGVLAVTQACVSREGWGVYAYARGDVGYWRCRAGSSHLLPGESVTMKLTTKADVPTSYDYTPYDWSSNWRWFVYWGGDPGAGNSVVPVPVPEPSTFLALAGGIAGVAGFVRRRRR